MVHATHEFYTNSSCQVRNCLNFSCGNEKFRLFSMRPDKKLLQFLMSEDFTARYADDDDQYEEDRYLQERHQNLPPPTSLIEQKVCCYRCFN